MHFRMVLTDAGEFDWAGRECATGIALAREVGEQALSLAQSRDASEWHARMPVHAALEFINAVTGPASPKCRTRPAWRSRVTER